jgi:translation initiation factor IF-3
MNDRIRVREVRLIDAEGRQVGIVPTDEAKRLAQEAGKDLVEVAPDARPPVCKIMDYGKFKYEQRKKTTHSGKKVHHAKLKEVRLRPKTEQHDYEVKLRHAKEFLANGDKVQLCLMFRGREMVHKDRGEKLLQRFITDLADLAKVERSGPYEGKRMTVLLTHK